MSKKNRKVRLLTAIIAAVMLISIVLSITLSASGTVYYGSSPSINNVTGSLNMGTENLYDKSVIYKLPDSVKPSDDISIIVQMKDDTLLNAYDASGSKLSFSEYILTEEANKIRENISSKADALKSKLSVDYQNGQSYNIVMSGFELIIKASDFETVCKAVEGEATVMVGEVYKPAETKLVENTVNVYGTGIFNSQGFGYDGTGTVVAVLDTGVDYYHSAFLDANYKADRNKLGLTFKQVSDIIADKTLAAEQREAGLTAEDVYLSDKIPFGFDYADNDSDVFPLLSNHGTHVAGVIAGNYLPSIESEDYSGEFVGVAPGAQIVAMKIFSDVEATAHTSWIMAALEDCVALGVDVINMSIGTACGFSRESDKYNEQAIYDAIRARGISLVVAASNSFNSAYSSDKNGNLPLTSNPDSSTVGSPSTYKGALSVASIEGAKTPYLTYNGQIVYFIESNDRFSKEKDFVGELLASGSDSMEIEYVVVAGAGRTAADYTGIDVKGKIALVKRGYNTFEEKAALAEEMGAAGVIIYNNVSGDIKMNVGEVGIPVCSISQDDGEVLAAAGSGKIVISRSQTSGPFISDFSSWGPTPDLQIKPEITAHGGAILSSVPGESYDRISGTSMATPNISGVTSLLRQFIIEKYNYDREADAVEIAAMVNRLMMSTADITFGKNGLPYAVRKQGAGLANLNDSAATNAYIATYNSDGSIMDKSKIELGDDPDKTGVYTLNFGIVNMGTSALSYDLSAYVLTEGVSETKTAQGETTVTEEAYELNGAIVEILSVTGGTQNGNNISVNGGTTANVSVRITLTEENKKYLDDSFENGMYVEGFIVLNNADDAQDLNVPYLAFYGDWTVAPLFDLDYYETNADELDDSIDMLDKTLPDAYATRPIGGSTGDYVSYLGSYYFEQNPANKIIAADRKYISLSNQSANNEINSLRFVWAGLLRNAQRVEITITEDSTGEVVYQTIDYDIRKSYGDGGPISPANIDIEFSAIDMNLKNNTQYTVNMKGYLDYRDGGSETNLNNEFSFPLVTDFSAPVLTDCEFYSEYDRSTKTNRLYAKMAIYDNHYSMALQAGYVGTDSTGSPMFYSFDKYATPIYSEFNSTSYVEFELTDYIDEISKGTYNKNTSFTIACYDYAMNSATYEIELPNDFEAFGFTGEDGGVTTEIGITLSPNEVYSITPVVYPATEWGELITYEIYSNQASDGNGNVINVVGNKIVAVERGGAVVRAKMPDGKYAYIKVTVLGQIGKDENGNPIYDPGYKKFDKPVADSFTLSGYYVNKAFYMLNNDDRDIGTTGSEMKFGSTSNYGLSMFPSESVTIRYDLKAYFPNTTVAFSSGNEDIVTVDQNGTITAVSEGMASITAQVMMDGKTTVFSATISINVKEPFVTSGPSLSHYYGSGDSSYHVIFPSTLAVTEIGQFAFSNFDYVAKDESEYDPEAPESMKMWYIGDSTIKKVTIPEGITRIGAYAFANMTALEEVILPSTLETIDYGAFYGCIKLKSVKGIENVKFINQSAFQGCAINGAVNFTNAVAIADYAFSENPAITSVKFSTSLQSIGAYAFGKNEKLKSVTIDAEKIKLGQYAFSNCTSLESININAAVISTGAFNECTSLKSVTLGKDVSVIGEYAFRNTAVNGFTVAEGNSTYVSHRNGEYLTNKEGTAVLLVAPTVVQFTLHDSNIKSIGAGAFSGNVYLASVDIPTITSVGDYAFSECENLSSINFFSNLTSIGSYAFENTGISNVEIRGDVKIGEYAFSRSMVESISIGDGLTVPAGAFANCTNLKTVTIGNNVTVGEFAFYNDEYHAEGTTVKRYVYNASTGKQELKDFPVFKVVLDGSITQLTIGNNVTLKDGAFYGASNLKSVSLGSDAKIGRMAFYNCPSLESIDLSKVREIGDSAFSGDVHYTYSDDSYSQVDINEKGEYTYCYYAAKLSSVDLSSAEKIGNSAFSLCKSLTTVVLGDGITHIPAAAFQYCDNLSSINLGKVSTIGESAFAECALTGADLSSAIKIGEYAFCYNAEMTALTLGDAEVIIGEGAFSYCDNLAEISGEENATYVGDYAFAGTKITDADLSAAKYIGTFAFYKDDATEFTVKLGNALSDMGDNPFANCIVAPFSSTVKESFLGKDYETVIYTFDISDTIKVIDGSVYRVVPNGLELICWMGEATALVADDTVRISAMAFAGQDVRYVVLPYTVKAIGHKAFYGCDKLIFVSFSSYEAPILEEEYDSAYYESMESIPAIGEYEFQDYYNNPVKFDGLGIIPYFMWNVTSVPSNFFYGANFIDYVGRVEDKITMIRPTNGKHYDSFILGNYFNLTIDGAAAADDITLAAIEAIKKLPTNTKEISLDHKPLVEAARAAYNKILSDEQRALVPSDVLSILTNAEKRIADLEFLLNNQDQEEPPVDGGKLSLKDILLIIMCVVFVLVVIAFVVVLIIFIRVLKKNPGLLAKKENEGKPAELDPEAEAARKAEIARYVAEARPTPAPKTPKKPINKAPNIDKLIEKHRNEGKKVNLPLIIALAVVGALIITGIVIAVIKSNESYLSGYDDQGYTVSVAFDPNGGSFKGSNSSIIDLYDPTKIGEGGLKLLAPEDPGRGKDNAVTLTKAGYFLAGWYRERTLINPDNPDEGYTYSGKWNFDTDTVDLDPNKEYTAEEAALTLYAAWVPYYQYEIYAKNDSGETVLISTASAINLTIPEWHDGDVTLNMDNFPSRKGYTLDKVYYLDSMTRVEGTLSEDGSKKYITGEWDESTATLKQPVIKLYTEWQEGDRYRIYTENDLIKNATSDGYYEIRADLDFTGLEWPFEFTDFAFNGKIMGKDDFGNDQARTISGISFSSTSKNRLNNGLFGSLGSNAAIENISFTNITHTIDLMMVAPDSKFGLLAGVVDKGAEFKNVSLSGKILIGDSCSTLAGNSDYAIGLVTADGKIDGITAEISVEKANPGNNTFDIQIDGSAVLIVKASN
ncbi:MAG: leucine-rich repeat protein [Clostridia bacterium]|nr:leucine-rich repeat protein [Clostridia bacterium]